MPNTEKKKKIRQGTVRVSFTYEIDLDDENSPYDLAVDVNEAMETDKKLWVNDEISLDELCTMNDNPNVKFEIVEPTE